MLRGVNIKVVLLGLSVTLLGLGPVLLGTDRWIEGVVYIATACALLIVRERLKDSDNNEPGTE